MARTKEGCERSKILKDIREQFGISEDCSNSVIIHLVEELYWQIMKLREIKSMIDEDGISTRFTQGKQDILIQNPAIKTYNDLIKNQTATFKNLLSITGSKANDDGGKEFLDFLNKGKKQKRVVS